MIEVGVKTPQPSSLVNIKPVINEQYAVSSLRNGENYTFEFGGVVIFDSKAYQDFTQYIGVQQSDQSTDCKEIMITEEQLALASQNDRILYSNMKFYTPKPDFIPEYYLKIPFDSKSLVFDSKFESGNLRKAIKVSQNEYNLILESDIGSQDCTQWYYFKVTNRNCKTVIFNILNLIKSYSLYEQGMQPLVWSQHLNELANVEWFRDCQEVQYYENNIERQNCKRDIVNHYTLSFQYTFQSPNDIVYFSYTYPFTYAQHLEMLSRVQKRCQTITQLNRLCYSLCGNLCQYLIVTNNIKSLNNNIRRQDHINKKAVIITSGVHPGESQVSYIVQGLIDFLTSSTNKAFKLRQRFIFYIIPCLNPDGLRYGNYRCSLLGLDLNRRWINPHEQLHPTIYNTKKLIQEIRNKHDVMLFCDLHGHSCKKYFFMYGNAPKPVSMEDKRKNQLVKLFPKIMSELSELFSYKNSSFKMERYKEGTARIELYKQGIINSYTLESSFMGYKEGDKVIHFTKKNFLDMGKILALACNKFWKSDLYQRQTYLNQPRICTQPAQISVRIKVQSYQPDTQDSKPFFTHFERRILWGDNEGNFDQKNTSSRNICAIHNILPPSSNRKVAEKAHTKQYSMIQSHHRLVQTKKSNPISEALAIRSQSTENYSKSILKQKSQLVDLITYQIAMKTDRATVQKAQKQQRHQSNEKVRIGSSTVEQIPFTRNRSNENSRARNIFNNLQKQYALNAPIQLTPAIRRQDLRLGVIGDKKQYSKMLPCISKK